MKFKWHQEKAEVNARKHAVSFEEATTVFGDPFAGTFRDEHHSIGEQRYITVGLASSGRLLVVSHTENRGTFRIISARSATTHERKRYAVRKGSG